jgi:hypothetical protein
MHAKAVQPLDCHNSIATTPSSLDEKDHGNDVVIFPSGHWEPRTLTNRGQRRVGAPSPVWPALEGKMVAFGLEEDAMGGSPATAGDIDESHVASSHLSVVQPDGANAEPIDAKIIEIAHVWPKASEHRSIIFAW